MKQKDMITDMIEKEQEIEDSMEDASELKSFGITIVYAFFLLAGIIALLLVFAEIMEHFTGK